MLNASRCEEAAHHLLAARRSRQCIARLAPSCRPNSIEEALAIQQRVQELLATASGGSQGATHAATLRPRPGHVKRKRFLTPFSTVMYNPADPLRQRREDAAAVWQHLVEDKKLPPRQP